MNTTFASGDMPRTDFHYEEFEGFLASYYLTYLKYKDSTDLGKKTGFDQLETVLNRLAQRHNIQKPEDAIVNPRAKEDWGKPHKFSAFSTKDSFRAFYSDFGISDSVEDKPDIQELWNIVDSLPYPN